MPAIPLGPLIVGVTLLFAAGFKYIIHPVFLSPLSRVPTAHASASISSLWILWVRHQFAENGMLLAAHSRLGPVVRLGPNEISVNCVDDGLRTIYPGGFEKSRWYSNLFENYNGYNFVFERVPNMFSTVGSPPHSARKRLISHVYSKSSLQNSQTMAIGSRCLIYQRLLPKLARFASLQQEVAMGRLFGCVFMDFTTVYQFGLRSGSNFIENDEFANWWLELYESRKKFTFWPQEMPGLTGALAKIKVRLSPAWVASANTKLEKWCLDMCDAAEAYEGAVKKGLTQELPQDVPVVYRQLKHGLEKQSENPAALPLSRRAPINLQIASELFDQGAAGHETSNITLTFLFYELAKQFELQHRLREESLTLKPAVRLDSSSCTGSAKGLGELPSPKDIDALPLLNAVLMETLRLHAAIPGPQPRVTPSKSGVTLGGYKDLPGNVRVSCNAHCLHRNPEVFPEPEAWKPERWLDEKGAGERSRWFWAFGSGGRMCIGSNLAMQSMKLVIASIVSNFRVERTDTGVFAQQDAYTAHPMRELRLRFLAY